MDFGEMKTRVRLLVGETDSDNSYYTDTEINSLLNSSILRVANDTQCLLTYKTLTVTQGTQTYGLPTDFLQLKDVQIILNGTTIRRTLQRLPYDEFEAVAAGNYSKQGQPAYYRIEFGATSTTAGSAPGDIWLYPLPNNSVDTLRVVFYQKPSVLSTSTEVTELPEFLHEAICYHAAWQLALKDDNQAKINNLGVMYKDLLADAKLTISKRDRSGPVFTKSAYAGSALVRRGGILARRGPLR
jgi:hypothetical protein